MVKENIKKKSKLLKIFNKIFKKKQYDGFSSNSVNYQSHIDNSSKPITLEMDNSGNITNLISYNSGFTNNLDSYKKLLNDHGVLKININLKNAIKTISTNMINLSDSKVITNLNKTLKERYGDSNGLDDYYSLILPELHDLNPETLSMIAQHEKEELIKELVPNRQALILVDNTKDTDLNIYISNTLFDNNINQLKY